MPRDRTKAVTYLRVSGRGQIDGDGFRRQRDAVEAYAAANGLEIIEEFRDAGVSGTRELEVRPGLAALLDRVESNGVQVVLVERADRLARDLMVSEIILGELREHGVTVSTAEGTDLTCDDADPTRTLIRQILGALAQFDKTVTVHKLRAARERMRREKGRCEGRKPFGSRPGEREVLARMRELRRKPRSGERRSFAEIARVLNDEGHRSRTGAPWSGQTVGGILKRTH